MDQPDARPDRGYRAALKVSLVRRLVAATSASVVGDYLGVGALLVMAADRTGGLAAGSAGVFAAAVPMTVLVGVVGGRFLDRLPRVRSLVTIELFGAALICLPLVIDGPVIVYVTAALLAGQRTATGAIRQGLVAERVPTRHRGPLIALSNTIDQSAQVLGYATGAAIYLLISPAAALLLDSASFVVAALVLLSIRTRRADERTPEETAPVTALPSGLALVRRDPVLRLFTLLVLVTATVAALPESLAPSILPQEDGRTALLLASGPLGQAVTLAILGRTRIVARPWFQLGHLALLAAALAIAAVAPGVGGLIVGNLLIGAGVAWILGPQLTFLRLVPPARMAQVTGLMWAAIATSEGGGALAFGALADRTEPRIAYLVGGVLVAVATAVGALVARRSGAVRDLERDIRSDELPA